jgi:hypothetical protein
MARLAEERNFFVAASVLNHVRYWGYLAAKLAIAGGIASGMLAAINHFWPPAPLVFNTRPPRFVFDLLYTSVMGLLFLFTVGLIYLWVLDQRYRCRVCLRRLRMPVETGSWGRMLFLGRPRMEYICPYGHGTLNVEELQISGLENPEWTAHADMWEELVSTSRDSKNDR